MAKQPNDQNKKLLQHYDDGLLNNQEREYQLQQTLNIESKGQQKSQKTVKEKVVEQNLADSDDCGNQAAKCCLCCVGAVACVALGVLYYQVTNL